MNSNNQNWKNLIEAIGLERDAEIDFHRKEIKELKPEEREKRGRAILNLKAKNAGFVLGERSLTEFSTTEKKPKDKTDIRRGDVVRISKMKDPEKEIALGTVWSMSKKISITTETNMKVEKRELYRIDLAANDITYKRMENAMNEFYEDSPNSPSRGRRNRNKIFKKENRWKKMLKNIKEPKHLNKSQIKAWKLGLKTMEISFIHGPPGTGKTTVATHIANTAAMERKDNVLICAPSNTAVDNIAFKLLEIKNQKFLRIGHPARMDPELEKYCLDRCLEETQDKNIVRLRTKLKLAEKELREIKHPGRALIRGRTDEQIMSKSNNRGLNKGQNKIVQNWVLSKNRVNSIYGELKEQEEKFLEKKIKQTKIILATASTCGSEVLENHNFDLCILDEASQAPIPLALIPMLISGKIILIGDNKQLSPVIKNREAIKFGLKNTLFDYLQKEKPQNGKMLKTQYRMREKILSFPNKKWYNNKINSDKKVSNYKNLLKKKSPIGNSEIIGIDTAGLFKENLTKEDHSWKNVKEAMYIKKITDYLQKEKIEPSSIGIISPYKAQTKEIKKKIKDIEVHTVDGFQGREKDLIIISLVRSNKNKNIGFLSEEKRLNVSLTRAKKHLVIIGDRKTFNENKIFNELWEFIERKGKYFNLEDAKRK